jgi:hypothetical protein
MGCDSRLSAGLEPRHALPCLRCCRRKAWGGTIPSTGSNDHDAFLL